MTAIIETWYCVAIVSGPEDQGPYPQICYDGTSNQFITQDMNAAANHKKMLEEWNPEIGYKLTSFQLIKD